MTSRKKQRGGVTAQERVGTGPTAEELIFGENNADTKTIQLCRQVRDAISYALLGSANPILRDLCVVDVEPLRGAARLRVLVCDEGDNDYDNTDHALERAHGYFRGEIARAINRKRVPTLTFVIVPGAFDDGSNRDDEVDHD